MQPTAPGAPDFKNLLLAILFATTIMLGWQYFFERPRQEALRAEQEQAASEQAKLEQEKTIAKAEAAEEAEKTGARIAINSKRLHGSIALTGGRIDTLTLAKYRDTLEDDSGEVVLLRPRYDDEAYFAEFGVLGAGGVNVPTASTVWKADRDVLTPDQPVTLSWDNGAGLTFEKTISLDRNYMFTVSTRVINKSAGDVQLYPYGLISRNYADVSKHYMIMHEGPLGVSNGVLNDVTYKDLREDGAQKFKDSTGWIGITDKYWLTALIPGDGMKFDAEYKYSKRGETDAYQVDLRGEPVTVAAGKSSDFTMRLFAGAKEVKLLDQYRLEYDIPLFDRAVDFGSLYFLTKPIFLLLTYFHALVGNFGLAILLLTVVIKLVLFPLANKSYTSMSQMKLLVPQMTELKERYADDKLKMNQAVIELYKKEGVNPMSGCLPILIQIPVFFALYKVLFVTIEMRHAPFFGWIHDLSAPDPTNLFTLFGLVPWDAPGFLHIGIWPLIMFATMVVQQRLNPKPADPVQAAVIGYMPYIFLFLFASFPAGLVIYWAWNNTLSIAQQSLIQQRIKKHGYKKKPAKNAAAAASSRAKKK
ncbi:MAG: membrane protein insertase YidC [Azospirillum brasilense]|nr:MAG: membrane protein insertase YidC [Azospirillum brasilense]